MRDEKSLEQCPHGESPEKVHLVLVETRYEMKDVRVYLLPSDEEVCQDTNRPDAGKEHSGWRVELLIEDAFFRRLV